MNWQMALMGEYSPDGRVGDDPPHLTGTFSAIERSYFAHGSGNRDLTTVWSPVGERLLEIASGGRTRWEVGCELLELVRLGHASLHAALAFEADQIGIALAFFQRHIPSNLKDSLFGLAIEGRNVPDNKRLFRKIVRCTWFVVNNDCVIPYYYSGDSDDPDDVITDSQIPDDARYQAIDSTISELAGRTDTWVRQVLKRIPSGSRRLDKFVEALRQLDGARQGITGALKIETPPHMRHID